MMEDEFTSEDSLQLTELEDGSLEISWDPNDPRYSYMNDMPEEELHELITNFMYGYTQLDDKQNLSL